MSARVIEVEIGERLFRFAVEPVPGDHRFRVTRDGTSRLVDVRRSDDHTVSFVELEGGAGSHEATVLETSQEGELDIYVDGVVVRAVVDRERRRIADEAGGSGDGAQELIAPMPGKVVRHLVAVGDEVVAKQGIVVVEAMKMENEITVAREGRVVSILVEEGQSVEAGTVIAVVE